MTGNRRTGSEGFEPSLSGLKVPRLCLIGPEPKCVVCRTFLKGCLSRQASYLTDQTANTARRHWFEAVYQSERTSTTAEALIKYSGYSSWW